MTADVYAFANDHGIKVPDKGILMSNKHFDSITKSWENRVSLIIKEYSFIQRELKLIDKLATEINILYDFYGCYDLSVLSYDPKLLQFDFNLAVSSYTYISTFKDELINYKDNLKSSLNILRNRVINYWITQSISKCPKGCYIILESDYIPSVNTLDIWVYRLSTLDYGGIGHGSNNYQWIFFYPGFEKTEAFSRLIWKFKPKDLTSIKIRYFKK